VLSFSSNILEACELALRGGVISYYALLRRFASRN